MCPTDTDNSDLEQQTTFMRLKTVGDYTLLRPIGIGGMGEVYLAEQKSMRRLVALKILLPALVNNKYSLERFFLEVRTLAKIEHPNIVQAIEAGIEDDVCFFSMMYVRGKNLAEIIKEQKFLDEKNALKIARDVAATLDYAWRKHQLIHRDVKPSNIMLSDDGMIKLLDLGISKIAGSEQEELTQCGTIVGSPYYVSPEQARCGTLDFHADMYSLGCTLYQMLTGQPPFDAATSLGIISKHFCEQAPEPKTLNKKISSTVSAITMRMIAKKTDERFPEWKDFINECNIYLNQYENSPKVAATPSKKTHQEQPAKNSSVKKLIFILLVTVIAAVILTVYSNYENKHRKIIEYCVNSINMATNCSEQQYPVAMARLEQVIRMDHPEYSSKAKELLKAIEEKIVEIKTAEEKRNVESAINDIKQKSYKLEQQQKYQQAIQLWQYQLNSSPLRSNQIFRNTATETIKYLQEISANVEKKLQ